MGWDGPTFCSAFSFAFLCARSIFFFFRCLRAERHSNERRHASRLVVWLQC